MASLDNILQAAYALFSERGFDRTPITDIAKRARVAGGTIIYHFKTKGNLLRILNWMTIHRLYSDIRQNTRNATDGLQALGMYIDEFYAFLASHPQECFVFLDTWSLRDPDETDREILNLDITIQTYKDQLDSLLEALIRRGCADGSIRPVASLATSTGVRSMLIGSVRLAREGGTPMQELQAQAHFFITERLEAQESPTTQQALSLRQAAG